MQCPKCQQDNMRPETYRDTKVLRCPICKGMFFDKGEIQILIGHKLGTEVDDEKFAPTSEVLDKMDAVCPRCSEFMPWVVVPDGLVMNQCPTCGAIFLDAGELASLEKLFS